MLDRILALIALSLLIGFLGIVVIWVPRIDLASVIIVSLGFAIYDMAFAAHKKRTD